MDAAWPESPISPTSISAATTPKVVAGAKAWLKEQRPDLVIISGDFTQRARIEQFSEASPGSTGCGRPAGRCSPSPAITTSRSTTSSTRFAAPLHRYRRYIANDLCPWFENDEVAVLGINTARSLTFKDGRINREQMALIRERFAAVRRAKTRILVTHHPLFAMPIGEGGELTEAVGRQQDAVEAVAEAGVHIALAGHFHRTYAERARKMVKNAGRALVIQAGTATSTRLRNNELQSFNWIHAHRNNDIELQVIAWDGTASAARSHVRYALTARTGTRRRRRSRPLSVRTKVEDGLGLRNQGSHAGESRDP